MKVLCKPEFDNYVGYNQIEELLVNFGVKKTEDQVSVHSSAGQPFTTESVEEIKKFDEFKFGDKTKFTKNDSSRSHSSFVEEMSLKSIQQVVSMTNLAPASVPLTDIERQRMQSEQGSFGNSDPDAS
jgi:hypothetical protein